MEPTRDYSAPLAPNFHQEKYRIGGIVALIASTALTYYRKDLRALRYGIGVVGLAGIIYDYRATQNQIKVWKSRDLDEFFKKVPRGKIPSLYAPVVRHLLLKEVAPSDNELMKPLPHLILNRFDLFTYLDVADWSAQAKVDLYLLGSSIEFLNRHTLRILDRLDDETRTTIRQAVVSEIVGGSPRPVWAGELLGDVDGEVRAQGIELFREGRILWRELRKQLLGLLTPDEPALREQIRQEMLTFLATSGILAVTRAYPVEVALLTADELEAHQQQKLDQKIDQFTNAPQGSWIEMRTPALFARVQERGLDTAKIEQELLRLPYSELIGPRFAEECQALGLVAKFKASLSQGFPLMNIEEVIKRHGLGIVVLVAPHASKTQKRVMRRQLLVHLRNCPAAEVGGWADTCHALDIGMNTVVELRNSYSLPKALGKKDETVLFQTHGAHSALFKQQMEKLVRGMDSLEDLDRRLQSAENLIVDTRSPALCRLVDFWYRDHPGEPCVIAEKYGLQPSPNIRMVRKNNKAAVERCIADNTRNYYPLSVLLECDEVTEPLRQFLGLKLEAYIRQADQQEKEFWQTVLERLLQKK